MNPKPLRKPEIRTESGRLEALYRDLENPSAVAVLAHPHPLHGGTMHNKVVFRAARGLEDADIATLRFNFRGAGASQGKHDFGDGEQRDFEAALRWLMGKHPGKKVFAGGVSFGAWVAGSASCDLREVDGLILIATPVNKYDFGFLRSCRKPMLFIHGSKDELGDAARVDQLAEQCFDAESVVVTGADHLFSQQVEVVQEAVRDWSLRTLARDGK